MLVSFRLGLCRELFSPVHSNTGDAHNFVGIQFGSCLELDTEAFETPFQLLHSEQLRNMEMPLSRRE